MTDPAPPRGAADDRAGRATWLVGAVIAVLLLPMLVAAVRALVDGTPNPGGDQAILQLRVGDVGGDTPVLGSYSRFGVNHPGPLWFYGLALPYRLLGADFGALQVGTLVAGSLSVATVAWIAWARGGRLVLLWTAALLAVFIHALGPSWVADPWEPKGLTLVVAALLFLTFDAMAGRRWALPVVALLASLLAQAQATLVVFAVTMGVLAAGAAVARAYRHRSDPGRRTDLLVLAGTALLVLLLWAPPLLQEVRNDPGNLTAFRTTLETSEEPELGTADAWRAVSLQLSHRPEWVGADVPLVGFSGEVDVRDAPWVPVGIVALVALAALAVRQKARVPAVLAAVVGVGVVVAVGSLARLIGPLFVWIPTWTQALGFGAAVAIGWCGYALLGSGPRATVEHVGAALLAVVVVVASALTAQDALDDRPADPVVAAVTELAESVAGRLDGTVLVGSDLTTTQVFGGTEVGLSSLVLALDDAGVDVVVATADANKYGDRRAQPARATSQLLLADADAAPPAGYRVVATADPLSSAQRAERADILARVPALAVAGPESLREVERLLDDPEVGPLIRRYQEIPDLPELSLLLREG